MIWIITALFCALAAVFLCLLALAKQMRKMKNENSCLLRSLNYFRFRDSLTGQLDISFAAKEFARLRQTSGGAVMVLIKSCEGSNKNITDCEITEVATILAAIGIGEVCRVENEAFMIFTASVPRDADKIFAYLSAIRFDGLLFAVGGENFASGEDDFSAFYKRIKRAAAAAVIGGCQCAVY